MESLAQEPLNITEDLFSLSPFNYTVYRMLKVRLRFFLPLLLVCFVHV